MDKTVIGIGVVFGVLILLWLVLEIMQKASNKKKADKPEASGESAKPVAQAAPAYTLSDVKDTAELVAIVSAAIAATLGVSVGSLKISAIKKLSGGSVVWSKVGKQELLK